MPTDPEALPWTENRPSSTRLPRFDLGELWAYRELGLFFALRDLKLRYKQTAFGVGWAILQPLVGALIFSALLGRSSRLPSDGIPYPVFVYTGLCVWFYFAGSLTATSNSLVANSGLVTKIYFPRIIAPLSAVLPSLIDLVVSLAILAAFMGVYGVAPSAALAFLPLAVVFVAAVVLAFGLWLAALNVQYRDVRPALGFLIQIWLFASPVVFASSLVPDEWRYVYALNPMVGVVDTFRWSLVGAPAPGLDVLVSLAVAALTFVGGLVYFGRLQRRFADVI